MQQGNIKIPLRTAAITAALAVAMFILPTEIAVPVPVTKQGCPKTTLTDIEDEVMCPVCGTPLAVVENAPQAKRERAFIADLIKRCRSKDQVKRALVAEFGPEVLATPSKSGFDLAAWLVPALALLLASGGIGLFLAHRLRRGAVKSAGPSSPDLSSSDNERLQEELSRLDP